MPAEAIRRRLPSRRTVAAVAAVASFMTALVLGTLPLAGQAPEETALWNLTYFLSSRLESEPATSGRSTRVPELVVALNGIFGKGEEQPVAFLAGGGNLLLRGTKEQVRQMKKFLAMIDSPWPQVQMTLWALQMSGSQERITCELEELASNVRTTREAILKVQGELVRTVRPVQLSDLQGCAKKLYREIECRRTPISLPVSGPLSLNESLILLAIHGDRENKVGSLREWVKSELPDQVKAAGKDYYPFRRLEQVLASSRMAADCEAFQKFLFILNEYHKGKDGAPEAVVRTGTILDRILKDTMDAYAADMSELFLDPLLRKAQYGLERSQYVPPDCPKKRKGDGVSLVGRSRIVVTSGLTSGLTPEMSSPVEISRPKAFTSELLDLAFPAKKEGSPELTGADRILAGLSQGQALLLAAALSEPETRFAKVAPGIGVKVRPTVLPDGAAARLTINAHFGVTTTPLDSNAGADTQNDPPAPAIQKHLVETDAVVGVFDLFDISSFSMTTSHPRTPFFVPILGRLPIIGRAFQWPRPPKVTHHESVILVNTVVLPRAVNLSNFYRTGDFERVTMPADCGPSPAVSPQ